MSASAAHGTQPTSFPRALLDAVFRRSTEAVLVIDADGCVVYASPGAEALLAIDGGDEASRCPLTSLVHPGDLGDGGWKTLVLSGAAPAVRLRASGGDWMTATLLAEPMSEGGFGGRALTVRRELAVASDEQTMLAHCSSQRHTTR